MKIETIKAIQSMGFDVYMRTPTDTWLIYTDGKNIGYLQNDRLSGYSLSTVHYPNTTTGTGFKIDCDGPLTKELLESAFCIAPQWASGRDVRSVKKYANIEAYLKANSFNEQYARVPV